MNWKALAKAVGLTVGLTGTLTGLAWACVNSPVILIILAATAFFGAVIKAFYEEFK